MERVKWKMSKKDMNSFIKSWNDCETELDILISKQKVRNEKLILDMEAIRNNP